MRLTGKDLCICLFTLNTVSYTYLLLFSGSAADRKNFNELLLAIRVALNEYQEQTGDAPIGKLTPRYYMLPWYDSFTKLSLSTSKGEGHLGSPLRCHVVSCFIPPSVVYFIFLTDN